MAKPTTLPRWSDVDPATTTTEPASGEKDTGFVDNTPSLPEYVNWLFYWIYQWIVWFAAEHTDRVLCISPLSAAYDAADWHHHADGYIRSDLPSTAVLGLALHTGDRVKSLTLARFGDGVVDCDVTVYKLAAAGTLVILNSGGTATTISNAAAAWTDTTIDLTDTTLAAGESVYVRFDVSETNFRLGALRLTYDRP